MSIEEKYSLAAFGTKEYSLSNLFIAYFNQDCNGFEETLMDYIKENREEVINSVIQAIEELLNCEDFSEGEKRNFIAEATSYETCPEDAIEWLIEVKKFLTAHVE